MALRRELRQLARDFADDLIDVLERHGVFDDPAPAPAVDDDQKRVRRSPNALSEVKSRILAELRQHRDAVAIGEIASPLGLTSRQITHPMSQLVDEGAVIRTGVRRGARYALAPTRRKRQKR